MLPAKLTLQLLRIVNYFEIETNTMKATGANVWNYRLMIPLALAQNQKM